MGHFLPLFKFGLRRRSKDFFVLFYNIVFPAIIIMLLGYLTSKSYGITFTSYHYYAIVIIPFCGLMGITTVSYAAQDEKRLKTSYRYIAAPISKAELVLSKFLSCVIIISICNGIILVISKLLFNMAFNGKFPYVILLLTCETVAVVGIGLFLGLACKNFETLRNFLNLPIVIFGFLGGVFFPVNSFNPILPFLINLSPLTWVNRGIVACIFDGKHLLLMPLIIRHIFPLYNIIRKYAS